MSTSSRKSLFVENLKKEQMAALMAQGKRVDGRGLLDYRELKIRTGTMTKAEGSSQVDLGNTTVIAGVKIGVGTPFPDTPDQGILMVGAEVLPVASAYSEPGPPDEDAIELARVVDRGVRESHMIDLSQLVIEPGKKVYSIFVDVTVLNVDGNLLDATSYAVVSALATTKFKKVTLKDEEVVQLEETAPLPVTTLPVSITTAKVGNVLFLDPTSEEESIQDARLTLAITSEGKPCAAQKGGTSGFTPEQVLKALDIAIEKSAEIREKIKEAVRLAKEG
jgi:exosome complex component RRP42